MNETIEGLKHQINTAAELRSVVRTMKALAAANISQYEQAVRSLQGYYQTIKLGLAATIGPSPLPPVNDSLHSQKLCEGWILFGSDQGMIGRFNSLLLEYAQQQGAFHDGKLIWTIGERLSVEIAGTTPAIRASYPAPVAVQAITSLVNRLLVDLETALSKDHLTSVYLFHNRPTGRISYEPSSKRLFPLEESLREQLTGTRWPTRQRPETVGGSRIAGPALIREYLFVLLYQACAESLASENASRLAAMEHAEKNIDELSENLTHTYNRVRQETIDEELFDVVYGAEAVGTSAAHMTDIMKPPAPGR